MKKSLDYTTLLQKSVRLTDAASRQRPLPGRLVLPALLLGFLLMGALPGSAQVLFSDDFDTDSSAQWNINTTDDASATFVYDYSADGIPPAPSTTNGTTLGVKFQANVTSGAIHAVSMTPASQVFTGDFVLRFDMWMNVNGPFPGGGGGSTEYFTAGVGVTNDLAPFLPGVTNGGGGWFAVSGEGGSTRDFRAYKTGGEQFAESGQFAAGTSSAGGGAHNSGDPYYSTVFPGGQTAPELQQTSHAQQTGELAVGTVGFAWRQVSILRQGDTVRWSIDGLQIATLDANIGSSFSTTGNVFVGYMDIFSSLSDNPALSFGLVDNVRVSEVQLVEITATNPEASEAGPVDGIFTISRTGDASEAATFEYSISGTASNGLDYVTLPGSVTLLAGEASTDIIVTPIDDSETEFPETVVLNLSPHPAYAVGDGSATVTIADNEPAEISIVVLQSNMYERVTTDFTSYELNRRGDVSQFTSVTIDYSGTAGNFADYNGNTVAGFDVGQTSVIITNNPIDDENIEGLETIIATIAADQSYVIGSPSSATAYIIDDDMEAETVLFSDDFDTDTSANWTKTSGAADGGTDDSVTFNYNYATYDIPPAPGGFTTTGLRVTANKLDTNTFAAGVNVYPIGLNVSNNYALRFHMFIEGVDGASTTEHALFGINHSGTKTNWAIRSTGGTGFAEDSPGGGDGIWFNIGQDASGFPGGSDYGAFDSTLSPPAVLASSTAASLAQTFKTPTYRFTGVPTSYTPNFQQAWVDVEVLQINGVITLSINKTPILQFPNTTEYNAGNIMLGYNDAFGSIGGGTINTVEQSGDFFSGYVLFDNVRVIDLTLLISDIGLIDGNVQIDFIGTAADTPASFELRSASTVNGIYSVDNAANFTQLSPGNFRVTAPANSEAQYYQIVKP